jgi:hypothetical protein
MPHSNTLKEISELRSEVKMMNLILSTVIATLVFVFGWAMLLVVDVAPRKAKRDSVEMAMMLQSIPSLLGLVPTATTTTAAACLST